MPLLSISAGDALAHLRRNALARWPDGRRDGRRLDGVVLPGHRAGFHLLTTDTVLTVGSCFARNMEKRLHELGFRVPAQRVVLPEEERGSDTVNDLLNKYNPHSIANEFAWAFEQPFPDAAYLELGPDEWVDPHLAGNVKPTTLRRLRVRRAAVTKLFQALPRCRCVIVTLGLVEAWFDQATGLYLNVAPPKAAIAREPDRFRFDVLGHDEVVAELERMWTLIRRHGSPKVRMLLTVSPVPLKTTFTADDVLVANGYSKSVLRAAAGAFAAAHAEVDYFPSYEAATLTARSTAFMEDNRHVAPELVEAVIDRVVRAYVPDAPTPPEAAEPGVPISAQARHHLKMGRPDAARRLLAQVARAGNWKAEGFGEFAFRYLFARTLIDTGHPLEAEAELARAVELQPESVVAHYARARALGRLGRPLRAEEAFRRVVELDPGHVDALVRLGRLELRNGKLAEAEATALAARACAGGADHADVAKLLEEVRAAASGTWTATDEPPVEEAGGWPARLAGLFAARRS